MLVKHEEHDFKSAVSKIIAKQRAESFLFFSRVVIFLEKSMWMWHFVAVAPVGREAKLLPVKMETYCSLLAVARRN